MVVDFLFRDLWWFANAFCYNLVFSPNRPLFVNKLIGDKFYRAQRHNVVRFDGTRIMMFLAKHGLAEEACTLGWSERTFFLIRLGGMREKLPRVALVKPSKPDCDRTMSYGCAFGSKF